jgi:hypothetical protein
VVSFANKPVSTPGNGSMYGVEFDTDLGYSNEGFFAGVAAGVLFPLSAMDQLNVLPDGSSFVVDAGNAWTLQTRLALQF